MQLGRNLSHCVQLASAFSSLNSRSSSISRSTLAIVLCCGVLHALNAYKQPSLLQQLLLYTPAYGNAAYLQVLGDGELTLKLTIKAAKFSGSAKEKIQAAGGEAVEVPQKEKWTRALGRRRAAAAAAAAPVAGSKKKTVA